MGDGYLCGISQCSGIRQLNDMAFRVNLNQSLSKYRNAFDLAARYEYLAAKTYDYETNLDELNAASARPLLTDIVFMLILSPRPPLNNILLVHQTIKTLIFIR